MARRPSYYGGGMIDPSMMLDEGYGGGFPMMAPGPSRGRGRGRMPAGLARAQDRQRVKIENEMMKDEYDRLRLENNMAREEQRRREMEFQEQGDASNPFLPQSRAASGGGPESAMMGGGGLPGGFAADPGMTNLRTSYYAPTAKGTPMIGPRGNLLGIGQAPGWQTPSFGDAWVMAFANEFGPDSNGKPRTYDQGLPDVQPMSAAFNPTGWVRPNTEDAYRMGGMSFGGETQVFGAPRMTSSAQMPDHVWEYLRNVPMYREQDAQKKKQALVSDMAEMQRALGAGELDAINARSFGEIKAIKERTSGQLDVTKAETSGELEAIKARLAGGFDPDKARSLTALLDGYNDNMRTNNTMIVGAQKILTDLSASEEDKAEARRLLETASTSNKSIEQNRNTVTGMLMGMYQGGGMPGAGGAAGPGGTGAPSGAGAGGIGAPEAAPAPTATASKVGVNPPSFTLAALSTVVSEAMANPRQRESDPYVTISEKDTLPEGLSGLKGNTYHADDFETALAESTQQFKDAKEQHAYFTKRLNILRSARNARDKKREKKAALTAQQADIPKARGEWLTKALTWMNSPSPVGPARRGTPTPYALERVRRAREVKPKVNIPPDIVELIMRKIAEPVKDPTRYMMPKEYNEWRRRISGDVWGY